MAMKINEMKNQIFQSYSLDEWEDAAEASLKYKTLNQLKKETYEHISLKPLYTKEDIEHSHAEEYPGEGFRTRGFHSQARPWYIAQMLKKRNWHELKPLLEQGLTRGQSTISFNVDGIENIKEVNFSSLTTQKLPFFLITKNHFLTMLDKVLDAPNIDELCGVIGTDLVSRKLEIGELIDSNSKEIVEWLHLVKKADQYIPNIQTILIDTTPYHNGGANAVQELAVAIAEAIYYLELLKEQGWKPNKTVTKLVFHFAVGSNFFMEIAKFRAFRKLWSTVAAAYGIPSDEQAVTISAETSLFTKSTLDPYVNLLRSGNEAFSAIIGGVDYLHVSGFDEIVEESSEFSSRIARNTQLILREESLLNKTADPGGGSYYIETLTNELVEMAWMLFQKIDKMGGIIEGLKSGWLQNEIHNVLEKRLNDISIRRKSMIGTNVYANLSEEVTFSKSLQEGEPPLSILPKRASHAFEDLRKKAKELERKGKEPIAGLICLGKLKEHKPRADFVTGFLASGGIKAVWSKECASVEDILAFVKKNQFAYYCICGTNESYNDWNKDLSTWITDCKNLIQVDIAGFFPDEKLEEWKDNGITGVIYMNQNLIEKLTSLLHVWEVQENE